MSDFILSVLQLISAKKKSFHEIKDNSYNTLSAETSVYDSDLSRTVFLQNLRNEQGDKLKIKTDQVLVKR